MFSVEFKTGFYTSQKQKDINEFKINTWIFVPNGLDINRVTYKKEQFYTDLKSNVRLITPIYTLTEILTADRGPFPRLEKAMKSLQELQNEDNAETFTYHTKMLLCILKSAIREETDRISKLKDEEQFIKHVKLLTEQITEINARYRSLRDILLNDENFTEEQKEYFLFGDEYLSSITEEGAFNLMRKRKRKPSFDNLKVILSPLLRQETANKEKMNYSIPVEGDEEHNSLILIKRSLLKKFIESDLYLQRIKKVDGAFAREFYYSLAAGLAMIFATIVSFVATQRFGNFTSALFYILVISYIFKDRIKEIARFYFSAKLDKKYFDRKWDVSIRKRKIGCIKEGFDFIQEDKVPAEILDLRNKTPLVKAENKVYDEKVILYRKRVELSKKDLATYKEYRLSGINDIIRLNLTSFIRQMDNPTIPIYLPDEQTGFKTIQGNRVYALYFVLECKSENDSYYKKYRLLFNRNGISDVSEIVD